MEGGKLKKNIFVCDDDNEFSQDCVERLRKIKQIKKDFNVDVLFEDTEHFEEQLDILKERRKIFRKGELWDNQSDFDKASILLIDFDLLDLPVFVSGEQIAYMARCFSQCNVIVGLNQIEENIFDLTLNGHPESFCDINIDDRQIDNIGLWNGKPTDFRPWYWQPLLWLNTSFEKRLNAIKMNLDTSITSFLTLDQIIDKLPRATTTFLGQSPNEITFREFVFDSGNGLKRKDGQPKNSNGEHDFTELLARISSSRIAKWLERMVLPGQDVFVDAPHLISRYPSLLAGDHSKIESWNTTAVFEKAENLGIEIEKIEAYRYKKDGWISREVWFWEDVSKSKEIAEVMTPWERIDTDFVFCEDTSTFHLESECREFSSGVKSPFIRRYVKYIERQEPDRIHYEPRVRFL